MYIHFDQLAKTLDQRYKTTAYNITPRILTSIEFLPREQEDSAKTLRQDTAYICDYSRLVRYEPNAEMAPLICIVDGNVEIDEIYLKKRPVVTVYGTNTAELLLALTNIIYEYGSMTPQLTEISRYLVSRSGIDSLIEAGFQLLGNPLVVTDGNHKIIAHTVSELVLNPQYKAVLNVGYLPLGHLSVGSYPSYDYMPFMEDIPVREDGTGDIPSTMYKILFCGGDIKGYLHVLQYIRPFTDRDSSVIELLGNLLAIELSGQTANRASDDMEEQHKMFLRDILDSEQWNTEHLAKRQKELGLKLKEHLYVVVAQAPRGQPSPHYTSFYELSNQMAALLPDCKGLLYKNSIFLLLGADEEIGDFEQHLQPIIPLLKSNNLLAGVSNVFNSVFEMQKSGHQAIKALEYGPEIEGGNLIFLYRNYIVYFMFELCLKSEATNMFILPEISNLITSGKRNIDDLLTTLRVYLENGRSKTRTSREMHTHINTIKYRIGLIEDYLNLDLNNDEDTFSLMLSLKLLEYLKANPPEAE